MIAEAADLNFVTHGTWIARHLVSMQVREDSDLVVVDSGLRCDTFNLVCRARLAPSTAALRAEGVVAYFRDVGRPFSWWVGPADRPADLGSILRGEGLVASESELLMAADLSSIGDDVFRPGELHVERVRTPQQLRDFADVSAANWNPPDPLVAGFYAMAEEVALRAECPLRFYVGYVDGIPVATAELTIGGGVAGLYNISTRASYRRRGFGTAMTMRPLLDARERGHTTAILQASPDGIRLYQRVGFQAFGEITEFKP